MGQLQLHDQQSPSCLHIQLSRGWGEVIMVGLKRCRGYLGVGRGLFEDPKV